MTTAISSLPQNPEPIRRYRTLDGKWLRAIERCKAAGLRAWKLDDWTYKVHSAQADGPWYRVYLLPNYVLRCECPAGQADSVCKHQACVYLRLERDGWPVEQIDTDTDLFAGEDAPRPLAPAQVIDVDCALTRMFAD